MIGVCLNVPDSIYICQTPFEYAGVLCVPVFFMCRCSLNVPDLLDCAGILFEFTGILFECAGVV